jgi:alkylation response protein AidB-like acyl-CoA dehydrogenase
MPLDFTLDDEHQLVKQSVRAMLDRYIPRRSEIHEAAKREGRFPQELWDAFAAIGLMGCLIPEEYGGNASGLLALTLAFEEISAAGFSPGLLLVTSMDASCIVRNGSEEMKRRFLPRIADGSKKFCFAVTEPDAGSNTFRIKTMAKRQGDVYVLNGQKMFISGVDEADHMLVIARTTSLEDAQAQGKPKSHGLALFVVDTNAEGLTRTRIPIPIMGEFDQFQLFFDDVQVPAGNLVGQEDAGVLAAFNSLNPERILAAAMCLGITDYCLKTTVEYATQRKVFKDTPIGAYQAISHPLAETKIALEATRLMTYKAAWAWDRNLSPAEIGTYANMAKFMAADMAIKAVDQAIETHGGLGFTEEKGLINLWSAVRLFKTAPVSREMLLNYVAEWSLGLPRSY